MLDTNVLLHNPNAIFLLADNEIIIPFDVIEELDKFKTGNDDLGRNARDGHPPSRSPAQDGQPGRRASPSSETGGARPRRARRGPDALAPA